jgi:DNA polymerase
MVNFQKLWIDCETYNETPITHGTYKYASTVEVMIVTWAFDDGEVFRWDVTDGGPMPEELADGLKQLTNKESKQEIWAHYSTFDRLCIGHCFEIVKRIPIRRWRDTMVQAFCHSLPGSLGELGTLFGLGEDYAKIKDGRRLIQLFCKPRPKNSKLRRATKETHPEDWAKFLDYAASDIVAMRALHGLMPKFNYPNNLEELEIWHLDQEMNDRGIQVNIEAVEAIIEMLKVEKLRLKRETTEKTDGELTSTTKGAAFLEYMFEFFGVHLDGLKKDQVINALETMDLPPIVKELLEIRQLVSKSSTAKYNKMLTFVSPDQRARGTLQFRGAMRTGRAGARGIQIQNFPSRGLPDQNIIDDSIQLALWGFHDMVGDPMRIASGALRRMLKAGEGKKLVVSDWSNIEGRLVAWQAGEHWKIEAFKEFDAGTGPDLYNLAYAKAFNVPVESVDKQKRAIGKVMELFLGYQGSVNAFCLGAAGYGFDMDDLATRVIPTLPDDILEQSTSFYHWCIKKNIPTYGLKEDAFIAAKSLVTLWRNAHTGVVSLWAQLEKAAILAITEGVKTKLGHGLTVRRNGNWLLIRLPSGRYLCYPRAEYDETAKGGRGEITYYGKNQYTNKWCRISTFGGKILENISQAIGSDIMYYTMPVLNEKFYPVIGQVHDEMICETPDVGYFCAEELSEYMCIGFTWTKGLPLAAEGFEDMAYKK